MHDTYQNQLKNLLVIWIQNNSTEELCQKLSRVVTLLLYREFIFAQFSVKYEITVYHLILHICQIICKNQEYQTFLNMVQQLFVYSVPNRELAVKIIISILKLSSLDIRVHLITLMYIVPQFSAFIDLTGCFSYFKSSLLIK